MSASGVAKRRRLIRVNIFGLVAAIVFLASQAYPSTEAVRLRNALLIRPSNPDDFRWTPAAVPVDFKLETHSPTKNFLSIIQRIGLPAHATDFDKSLLIAKHLQQNVKDRGPIQSDLDTTYKQIVSEGYGYCADFTDVFIALSLAAGIPARQWAFSFDGFGGHGHAINEIFDRGRGKWIFLDVFNNFYAADAATGEPLSALEFRDAVIGSAPAAKMIPIGPARPGFRYSEKALDYYRRGAKEWYLWWGNNVYTYDQHPLVRLAGGVSRSLEQFGGILAGVYPNIKVLRTPENAKQVDRMFSLKIQIEVVLTAIVVLSLLLLAQTWSAWRTGSAR
jgi:Transglutaminase-like superfamily